MGWPTRIETDPPPPVTRTCPAVPLPDPTVLLPDEPTPSDGEQR